MKNLLKHSKKIVLGAFLTLTLVLPATQVAAQAPGGPFITYGTGSNPFSMTNTWNFDKSQVWDIAIYSTAVALSATKQVGTLAKDVAYGTYDLASAGFDAACDGLSFVKKASIFTYMVAQKGWSATKWAAGKTHAFYKWASGEQAREEQEAQERAEHVARVHSRLTSAPSNFV